jgi:hypothetical protein
MNRRNPVSVGFITGLLLTLSCRESALDVDAIQPQFDETIGAIADADVSVIVNVYPNASDTALITTTSWLVGSYWVGRVTHDTEVRLNGSPNWSAPGVCVPNRTNAPPCQTWTQMNCFVHQGETIQGKSTHTAYDLTQGGNTIGSALRQSSIKTCPQDAPTYEGEEDWPYEEAMEECDPEIEFCPPPPEEEMCTVLVTYWTDTGEIVSVDVLWCW